MYNAVCTQESQNTLIHVSREGAGINDSEGLCLEFESPRPMILQCFIFLLCQCHDGNRLVNSGGLGTFTAAHGTDLHLL